MNALMVAVFGASAMATFALGLWLPAYLRHRAISRRLASFVLAGRPGGLAIDAGGRRPRARALSQRGGRLGLLARVLNGWIASAQTELTLAELAAASAALGTVTALAILLVGPTALVLSGGLVGAALPLVWLRRRARALQDRFVAQLSDTVDLLAGSIRAGHSLLQALEHVATEAPEPTKGAIAAVVREIGLGASQEDALERLVQRYPSEDLLLIVTAINVHHQIGGSLSKILDVITETIRERARITGDIRGLTSQQRYSAYVLSLLPVVVAIALTAVSPDYVAALFEYGPLRAAAMVSAGLVVLGFMVMRRIAAIDV